jgi:hypothetical protein
VRKLGEILQTTALSKIFRDFFVPERSESSKKGTKRIRLKASWRFYTPSVDSDPTFIEPATSPSGGKRALSYRFPV